VRVDGTLDVVGIPPADLGRRTADRPGSTPNLTRVG